MSGHTSIGIQLGKGDLIRCNVYPDHEPILRLGDASIYIDDDMTLGEMLSLSDLMAAEADKFIDEIRVHVKRKTEQAKAVLGGSLS